MNPNLHERIAEALGWTVQETQSFSLPSLREMVRTVSPKLAAEISHVIATDSHILQPHRPRRRRFS